MNENDIFYSSIFHTTSYFESIEGTKKVLEAKLFEDTVGKKIKYIKKVNTKIKQIRSCHIYWKLIEKNVKFNRKYNKTL